MATQRSGDPLGGRRVRPDAIRRYLQRSGETQADLARCVGISDAHVSLMMRGLRRPSVSVLLRLASHTGLAVEALLGAMQKAAR